MEADGGRSDVLGAARRALLTDGRVVIVGTGGIGKTTIARRLVGELPSDEVVWIELDHIADPDQAESILLDAIGERAAAESAAALMRSSTEDRRVAIVLDGADSVIDTVLDVTEAVPVSPDGPWLVIASRVHPIRVDAATVHVGPLQWRQDDVHSYPMSLFRDWFVGAGGSPAMLDEHRDAVSRLVDSAAGIPLALRVTAATSAAVGLDAAEAIVAAGDELETLSASLARSLDALDATARRLFDAIAVTSGFVDVDAVAAISDLPADAARRAIGTLVRHHLLDVSADGYRMLPPIHRFAVGRARELDATEAVARHLTWCRSRVGTDVLRHEADIRLAIERFLSTDGDAADDLVRRLAYAQMLDLRQHQACELLDDVLDRPELAAAAGVDRRIELLRLSSIAHCESEGVVKALRLLDEADRLVASSKEPERASARLGSMRASFEHDLGRLDDARRRATSAAVAAAQTDDVQNVLQTDCFLAAILQDLGRLEEAEAVAASVVDRCGDEHPVIAAMARSTRAMVAVERGDSASCAAMARHELAETSVPGNIVDAEFLLMLADPIGNAGLIDASSRADRSRPGEWMVYLEAQASLTMSALVDADADRAMTIASDIVVIAEAVPIAWLGLEGLQLLGDAAIMAGDRHQARAAYRRAFLFANEHGFVLRAADALDGLASLVDPGEIRTAMLACGLHIRTIAGAVARRRPWAPPLDASSRRLLEPPAGWLRGSRLSPTAVREVLAATSRLPEPEAQSMGGLSPAELRVARLVAEGCTNRAIGERLHISRRTVETHVVHAFQKLGVHNRTQLATAMNRASAG